MEKARKPLLAANWKMNTTVSEGLNLILNILSELEIIKREEKELIDILICPPFITLKKACEVLDHQILIGAQNTFWEEQGAYTGEISPLMLKDLVKYVIIGHSERRQYFNEFDEIINKKIKAVLPYNLIPILCVGESLEIREAGNENEFIKNQIKLALEGIEEQSLSELVIAYEPIWAIGTGKAALPSDAQEINQLIRQQLKQLFSENFAERTRILYGGSANAENIASFINEVDVDGALVGGASLKVNEFLKMIYNIIEFIKS